MVWLHNLTINWVVITLFIRGRKTNISLVFMTQSYFKESKDVRSNSMHYFIIKVSNKRELQQIAINHSTDIDFKDFMMIYKKCIVEPCIFSWCYNFNIR